MSFIKRLFHSDILSLPIPEILYCHYSGDEVALVHAFWQLLSTIFQKHDAFVMENLVASGEKPFKTIAHDFIRCDQKYSTHQLIGNQDLTISC